MNSARYVAPADVEREPVDVRMHPADVSAFGLADGEPVVVRSAHGRLDGVLRVDAATRAGVVSCTHGDVSANVGSLTSPYEDVDPETGMPTASGVAVTVLRE
jgi:anaerobic selenocysteine-containing dehydrogenase